MDDLAIALEIVLHRKAERFIKSPGYITHVQKCIEALSLTDPRLAFIFGGLDAMQQDFGSAAQMTRPPGSPLDVSFRSNRLTRLQQWMNKWKAEHALPFKQQ
jgi:hypothetical protein